MGNESDASFEPTPAPHGQSALDERALPNRTISALPAEVVVVSAVVGRSVFVGWRR